MDWVADTVAGFGNTMGLPGLTLDEEGCTVLAMPPAGMLSLQDLSASGGNEVLVAIGQPLNHPQAFRARQALLLADFRAHAGWGVQPALRGESMVVTLRMPRHAFLLSALEEAIDTLLDFHARVERAG